MLNKAFIRGSAWRLDNGGMLAFHLSSGSSRSRGRSAAALVVAVLVALTAGLPSARAEDRHDHERARAALQAGEVLPLSTVLDRLQRSHPGQVLELELERDDGLWVYELKLLQADGQLLKLKLDARTAQVLSAKRRDGSRPERNDGKDARSGDRRP